MPICAFLLDTAITLHLAPLTNIELKSRIPPPLKKSSLSTENIFSWSETKLSTIFWGLFKPPPKFLIPRVSVTAELYFHS